MLLSFDCNVTSSHYVRTHKSSREDCIGPLQTKRSKRWNRKVLILKINDSQEKNKKQKGVWILNCWSSRSTLEIGTDPLLIPFPLRIGEDPIWQEVEARTSTNKTNYKSSILFWTYIYNSPHQLSFNWSLCDHQLSRSEQDPLLFSCSKGNKRKGTGKDLV